MNGFQVRITEPKQVNDLIMVRLFTYDYTGISRIFSPAIMDWAKNRGINFAIVKDKKLCGILPDEMSAYMDWAKVDVANSFDLFHDVMVAVLEQIEHHGWNSTYRKMRKFSSWELEWIRDNIPECYEWMRPRK